eukprot:PhM_4_TR18505/c0_g1_i1/m.56647
MKNKSPSNPHPAPAWTSPEYIFYFVYSLYLLVTMMYSNFRVTVDHADELKQSGRTAEGWWVFGGRAKDISDTQWRDFSGNLPLLIGGMGLYIVISRLTRRTFIASPTTQLQYYCLMNLLVVYILHGNHIFFMVVILVVHYAMCRALSGTRAAVPATWVYTISVLFLNEWYRGYRFAAVFGPSFAWLDANSGLYRWNVTFNMSILRMISFACDDHESIVAPERRDLEEEKHADRCDDCTEFEGPCYSLRVSCPRKRTEYTLVNYLGYVLYFPTYFGGPTTTFNAWVSHATLEQQRFTQRDIIKYAIRLINLYVWLEVSLHFVHINAIRSLRAETFGQLSPGELAAIGFYTLNFLWMKFAFIWRFCRLVALIDGVEVPENMLRCWANNYLVTGFWRNWHSSFNKWIVRYMYVPLGGSRYKALNVWPIFTFVAFWHDITLQLFQWAWVMSLFFLPEFLGQFLINLAPFRPLKRSKYFRHLTAVGGAINISFLIIANLIGYGVGTSKTSKTTTEILSWDGALVAAASLMFFFCVTNIMLKLREVEAIAANERHERLEAKRKGGQVTL